MQLYIVEFDENQNVTVKMNPTPDAINVFQEREARKLKNEWREGRGETCTPSQRLNRDILRALCEIPARPRPTFSGRAHRVNPASQYATERALFEHSIGGI